MAARTVFYACAASPIVRQERGKRNQGGTNIDSLGLQLHGALEGAHHPFGPPSSISFEGSALQTESGSAGNAAL